MSTSSNMPLLRTKNRTVEEIKLYDIQMKMDVARHVVTACMNKTINKKNISENEFYIEAHNYITASTLLLTTILAKLNNKEKYKTFADWFEELSWEKSEDLQKSTKFIDIPLRNCFINHYLNMQCIPTKVSICNYLKNEGINMTIEKIKKILKIKGYKSQRLPRSTATIIVENPEQRLNRMQYLHNIMQFRELDMHIVYIDEIKIKNDLLIPSYNFLSNAETTLLFVAVSSLLGIINKKIQKISPNEPTSTRNIESVDDWILNNVLQHLSIKSVIVLENNTNDKKNQTPTINSNKSDMIKWLEKYEIPHSSKMHSAELFELIKRSKRTFTSEKHKLDEILMAYGHKVLRRPRCNQHLNILQKFQSPDDCEQLNKYSDWRRLELNLIENEKKVYSDDVAVDETIDKILTYAKYETLPYIYVSKCDEDIDEIKMTQIVQD